MRITTFCLVALFGRTLVVGNPIPSPYVQFGEDAWIYGLGPLWAQKKHFDQTHNTVNEIIYAPENKLYVANTTNSPLWVTPNPNVMVASAHLDLSNNSVRLFVKPNPGGRFYSWQIMDAFTNSRWYISSTNNPDLEMPQEGNFAFVYSNCTSSEETDGCKVPNDDNITIIETDTPIIWAVARYYVSGDRKSEVNEAKDALLSSTLGVAKGYNPSNGNAEHYVKPGEPVLGMNISDDPLQALDDLNEYISVNGWGPIPFETKMEFETHGLYPGSNEKFTTMSKVIKEQILLGVKMAQAKILTGIVSTTSLCHGWRHISSSGMGNYGTNFLLRSVIAYVGLGANIPTIGMYFGTVRSGLSLLLTNSTYTITLPREWVKQGLLNRREPFNTPGFWSVTPYNLKNGHLLNTTIKSVSYPNHSLVTNRKGQVVIWLSSKNPTDTEDKVNWLPLPDSEDVLPIYLIFRIYGAKERVVHHKCPPLWMPGDNLNIPRVVQVS